MDTTLTQTGKGKKMATTTYKGRTYNLLWSGKTKYGRRAKLGFTNGTKEFWVDESKIGGSNGGHQSRSRRRVGSCQECGDRDVTLRSHDGMRVCESCASHHA